MLEGIFFDVIVKLEMYLKDWKLKWRKMCEIVINWWEICCVVFLKCFLSYKNILFFSKFKERVFEYEVFIFGIIYVLKSYERRFL